MQFFSTGPKSHSVNTVARREYLKICMLTQLHMVTAQLYILSTPGYSVLFQNSTGKTETLIPTQSSSLVLSG